MVLYEIKTCRAPAMPGWLVVFDGEHIYVIPEDVFISIVDEAGRRFKTLVPLAPYPAPIGLVWQTNKQIYSWVVKRLREAQEKYEHVLHASPKRRDKITP